MHGRINIDLSFSHVVTVSDRHVFPELIERDLSESEKPIDSRNQNCLHVRRFSTYFKAENDGAVKCVARLLQHDGGMVDHLIIL